MLDDRAAAPARGPAGAGDRPGARRGRAESGRAGRGGDRLVDPVGRACAGCMTRWGSPRSATRRSGRWCWAGSSSRPASSTPSGSSTSSASASPSRVTFMRCLKRVIARDYRSTRSPRPATGTRPVSGGLALVLYDLTTLYFETPREDGLRKVGMSKERRVDPQVTVGLLTDRGRVPAGRAPVRGQQGRDQDLDPGPDRVRRPAPRHHRHRGGRRRRDALGGQPARAGGGRVPVHRRLQDQQGALRPDRALRALRQRLRRRADHRDQPHHGHRQGRPQPTGGLAVVVHPLPPRHPGDQRHDRTRRSRRRREAPVEDATGSSRSPTPNRSWTGTWSNAPNKWPG